TLTDPVQNPGLPGRDGHPVGIDYFSDYICEDHLIGDLLWRSRMPGLGNHGMVLGDLAIQPMDGMSVDAYAARRVRWLRARKWTVLAATLVEPGVESLLCCVHFGYALTTIPWFNTALGIPRTWSAMLAIWGVSMCLWLLADRMLFNRLHACGSVGVDADTPRFARGTSRPGGVSARPFKEWLAAWLGRELLALPIWTKAVLLGATVNWRGKTFTVRMDMSVVEKGGGERPGRVTPEIELGRNKNRVD
ncbi:hypothetical protein IMZ48_27075, partial [Candidatus Bathyarchaeota archaeon]|nr:hypothetical protein [Candidatus Bathyarchaeota archaeon]